MARKKIKTVLADKRYQRLRARYKDDWVAFAVLCGKRPTKQQRKIIKSISKTGAWTSVSSGHGTGKSDMTSILLIAFILFFPESQVIIVANKISQVQGVIWKYLKSNFRTLCKNFPWLAQYFTVTETAFYANGYKGEWCAVPKGCRIGNEESLAGAHNKNLLYVLDEASGISDAAIGVVTGALSEENNRLLMLSQPTRNSGYFYRSHNELAKHPGNPDGLFDAIVLNSEESELVTVKFIRQKIMEYGGTEAPEYLIKVRGQFPKNVAGMLLGRAELDAAVQCRPTLAHDWGWLCTCDVGNGRDKSVMTISKVSGERQSRVVIVHKVVEMDSTIDPVRFADYIFAEVGGDTYPNISIAVDSDGVGYDTATCLERYGLRVQRIRWGKKMFTKADKQRFINQRAYAHIAIRDAVQQGRIRLDANVKTVEQGSRLPCAINESGQWVMMPKKVMKEKHNISSPDRFDTICFTQIAEVLPRDMEITEDMEEIRTSVEEWVTEAEFEDLAA
ncbi:terminase [Thaumasiovibrio sp. DFM-14]|uniref:terminase n=1 Tax=Thaumasiovibrio sp. DFM-14 TaxID=3384792 RepID=UPI0039A32BC6